MTTIHDFAAHYLNGQHSAENYIDECVLRDCQEPHMLQRIIVAMPLDTDAGRAHLMGFTDFLHLSLKAGGCNA